MTEFQRPLSVLGLPDGASEADIRRAYAQRLKTTHPEDDPEGFKQLRWAYEAALNEARWRTQFGDDSPEDEGEALGEAQADAEMFEETYDSGEAEAEPIPFERTAGIASRSSEEQAHAAICNRLGDVLQEGADLPSLHAALDAVLASPALANVDVYNRTESWLVHLLTSSAPKSYPLLDRVIAHFHWDKHVADHRNTGPAAVLALRDRIPGEKAAADFLKRVSDRRHEFNRAYKETMRDPYSRNWLSRFWALRRFELVERFILYIDKRVPIAIEQLNEGAVFWWRNVRRGPLRFALAAVAFARAGVYLVMMLVGAALVLNALNVWGSDTETVDTAWLGPRAECERAMTDLRSHSSRAQFDSALEHAWSSCRRELAAAPDSLLLSQHVGVIALAAGRAEDAQAQFDAILAASPNDPYALFGKGLAVSDAALTGEAVKREPETMAFFMAYPVRIAAPTPFAEEPKSRWEKRTSPKFDTRSKRISGPSDEEMQELMKHFGRRQTPVGEALLNCLVGKDGGVSECVILDETPLNQGVGEFALRMAAASKFEPAKLKGEAVDRVPVNYTIRLVDENGMAPSVRTGSLGEFVERLTKETREKAAAPSVAPLPKPPPKRSFAPSKEQMRLQARAECEAAIEASQTNGSRTGGQLGEAWAKAARVCKRELGIASDSLVLSQHVGVIALASGQADEALERFDAILKVSPNDPRALFGKGLVLSDAGLLAEGMKRDPDVKTYYMKFLILAPDFAPMEEEPKSRWEKRPAPPFDTQTKRIGEASDQEMMDLLMHFGVRRTPVGEAQLNCLVGADGSVFDCVIVKEAPYNQGVGEFAIRMATLSTFEPAKLNGEAVDRMPLNYTITLVEDVGDLPREDGAR